MTCICWSKSKYLLCNLLCILYGWVRIAEANSVGVLLTVFIVSQLNYVQHMPCLYFILNSISSVSNASCACLRCLMISHFFVGLCAWPASHGSCFYMHSYRKSFISILSISEEGQPIRRRYKEVGQVGWWLYKWVFTRANWTLDWISSTI